MLLEIGQDLSNITGVGVRFREGQPDLTRRQAQAGADFEELQADRRALGFGKCRTGQAQPAQAMQQDIGKGREVQPQLVRP